MAVRHRIPVKNKEQKQQEDNKEKEKFKQESKSKTVVLCILVYLCMLVWIAFQAHWYLPQPNLATDGNAFSTLNARKHLKAITDIGIRNAGSYQNDILARDVLLSAIEHIKNEASPEIEIETSVQQPSGHFHLAFLGGMTHLYENLTNVVVRLSRRNSNKEHALLVNCHFDSALGSPAASDDAVSCSILLESLRCLSTKPSPFLLKYSVIFLFNGAEEMGLPAAHGFITQHPWASQVHAFLNLEAAGAGGKEVVFQTGPKNPWLGKAYTRVAPYPHTSVIGQEIFESGIIPSDTDFRIFRDYGNIPGIDMAFVVNGYVYHTEYDTPDRIPDGSIQRAGENILALIKEIANLDQLVDPGEDKHGKVTYFDVLGLFNIVYPERIGLILNYITLALTIIGIFIGGRRKYNESQNSYVLIIKSVLIVVLSILTGMLGSVISGLLTTIFNSTLAYYCHPLLVLPLYYAPIGLGTYLVHYWWSLKNFNIPCDQQERIMLYSNQLLLWILLLLATYYRLSSSCVPMMLLLFLVVFRTFIWDNFLKYRYKSKVGFISLHFVSLSPLVIIIVTNITLMELFIPLMGRFGAIISPDIAIPVICTILIGQQMCIVVPTIVNYSTKLMSNIIMILLASIWLIGLSIALLGLVQPFSGENHVCPKRLYIQHSHVTYHDNTKSSFSGMYVHTLDYRELDTDLIREVPLLKDAAVVNCTGIYCGIPSYFPVIHLMKKSWLIPGPRPPVQSAEVTLENVAMTSVNTRNYSFVAKLPNNARLHIEPVSNQTVKSWSFDSRIPDKTPYGNNQGCYYILYTRGTGNGVSKFWIEIEGKTDVVPALEIAAVALYINHPLSKTPFLDKLTESLPNWVSPITFTSTLDVKKF